MSAIGDSGNAAELNVFFLIGAIHEDFNKHIRSVMAERKGNQSINSR